MALGSGYNNKDKQDGGPSIYSDSKLYNKEGFDPSMIGFTFWNGMLKMYISPMKEDGTYEHKANGVVYLHHIKAKQLYDELERFKLDQDMYKNLGVTSGGGLVSVSDGVEFTGKKNPCIVIRKINEETGAVDASFSYEFKHDFHYSVRNYVEADQSFDKIFNNLTELESLQNVLISFYNEMTGAGAYAGMYYGRFQQARIDSKMDSMCEKLGVEVKDNSYGNKKSAGSAFDKKPGRSYTLDEV